MMRVFILLIAFLALGNFSIAQLTAEFSATPLNVCIGDEIQFTDLSSTAGTPITDWNWDFGDGGASIEQNAAHTYLLPGTYNVTLTIQGQDGSSDFEVKPAYVTVSPLPVSNFSLVGSPCSLPFDASFSNLSSSGNDISYDWDFGNGQTSVDFSPTGITYAAAGSYDVSLSVSNATTGCTKDTIITIDINELVAGISAPDTVCLNDLVQIDNASIPAGTSWAWNYGDGGVSFSENGTHTYTSAGTFNISLTMQDSGTGCQDNATQSIVVLPLPVPSFTADILVGCSPLDVTFTNTSIDGVDYNWIFGNGDVFAGETPGVITYSGDGSYSITLSMTDDFGCTNSTTQSNMINIEPVVAEFSSDVFEGCALLDVQFSDLSVEPNPGNDPIVSWDWDFGNGNVFSGQNPPIQTYDVGTYDVSLTVTTSNGCSANVTSLDTITVGQIDLVDFSMALIDSCAKSDFDFTDLSVISVPFTPEEVTYEWDFGDGGTSTDQNPTYNYPNDTGYFDVQLIIDFRGCRDTLVQDSMVYILAPISRFSASQTLFCNEPLPINIDFTDNSIIGALPDDAEMFWTWDDGTFTNFDDPDFDDGDLGSTSHIYANAGSYTIQQAIYNYTTGCEDSTTVTIVISETTASFIPTNDSVCVNSNFSVVDNSTSTDSFGTYSYSWGDASANGNAANDFHSYSSPGTYNIVLTATNSVGCADDTIIPIEVLSLPVADLSASALSGCVPLDVTYTNNSTSVGNGVALESFLWTFSDLSTETTTDVSETVSFNHTQLGTFAVTLVVTDEFGCVSPLETVSVTTSKPNANFTVDPIVCNNASFNVLNGSGGVSPVSYEWFVDGVSASNSTNFIGEFNDPESAASNVVNHLIQLVATDVNGCVDTMSQNIDVSVPHANVNYSFNGASVNGNGQYVCPPVFASLEDTSSSYGAITNWSWTFGNGNSSIDQNPNNTYVFAGTYTATLSIVDEYGCVDDTILVDYLSIAGPSAVLSLVNVGDACSPTYQFVADSLEDVFNIEWTLDDGSIVNSTDSFEHDYLNGTYTPTAIVSDTSGCVVPYTLPTINVISNDLEAFFTGSQINGNVSDVFVFDDMSTFTNTPIVNWSWDFDNNQIDVNSDFDVENTWFIPGAYPVTLTITDANGCQDSYSVEVLIDGSISIPNVFTPNNDGANDFFTIDFDIFDGYDIVILNRWGNVVQEIAGHSGTVLWDGTTMSGEPCNEGVYFYKLTGNTYSGEFLKFHGNVTLIRD